MDLLNMFLKVECHISVHVRGDTVDLLNMFLVSRVSYTCKSIYYWYLNRKESLAVSLSLSLVHESNINIIRLSVPLLLVHGP